MNDRNIGNQTNVRVISSFTDDESTQEIENIDKILMDNQTTSHCQPVLFYKNDEDDEFLLLDQVLSGVLRLDKAKFVKNVLNHYFNNIEPIKSQIGKLMRKENINDIKVWKADFLKRKYSLTFQYLPFLSAMYNLIFLPCIIKPHHVHKRVFVPTGEKLDFSNNLAKTSVYVLTNEMNIYKSIRLIKCIFVISDSALNYLHNQLDNNPDQKTRVELLVKIASYHCQQAEKIDRIHHMEALQKWNEAKINYDQALKLNHKHLAATLGYVKCLIMLSKFTPAKQFLIEKAERYEFIRNSPEQWFLLGMIQRKLEKYDEAKNAIEQALKLQTNFIEAQKELDLIIKLQQETVAQKIKVYKKTNLMHSEPNTDHHYNILSVDGGGIRGLIPAMWLSELERRTQRSISSMFHMIAGTSTGGIIAAGLSLRDKYNIRQPRYKAVDLVDLYTTHARRVFSPSTGLMALVKLTSTYTEQGRKSLFQDYFEESKLSDALNDLLITATHSGSSTTELFRRTDALINPSKNHKIVDVLMCTTAAPTYFPPYVLNGCTYLDGGVQANNPAMFAYSDTRSRKIKNEQIFMLSLGTGDYVPDPLHPNSKRNLLFWMYNYDSVQRVVVDVPQNNIVYQLSNLLENDNYHRWQIWLENVILLDDVKNETLDHLKELARAHFEEMDCLDTNNRLGKLIERLKD